MSSPLRVVVIGAGAAGTLLAVQLLRRTDLRVDLTLVDRSGVFGRGVAYSSTSDRHTLNVMAHLMGGLDQADVDGYVHWLGARTGVDPAALRMTYPPRSFYGAYLQDQFAQSRTTAAPRSHCRLVHAEATRLERLGDAGWRVQLDRGGTLEADLVALCLGNADPPALAAPHPRIIEAPWRPGATHAIPADARVVMIGTGLTMIDTALELDERGHRGALLGLSRHGHVPLADAPPEPYPDFFDATLARRGLLAVSRALRAEVAAAAARGIGWHSVVEAFRVHAGAIWSALDEPNRDRFLRHARSVWLVHRHRVPPEHIARIGPLRESGRLQVLAARIVRIDPDTDSVAITFRPRGGSAVSTLRADWLVNCTGPESDYSRIRTPLVRSLLAEGHARPDRYRLGLEVDADLTLVDAAGRTIRGLVAIGSLTRGRFWEVTAVPHLRRQIEDLVARLASTRAAE